MKRRQFIKTALLPVGIGIAGCASKDPDEYNLITEIGTGQVFVNVLTSDVKYESAYRACIEADIDILIKPASAVYMERNRVYEDTRIDPETHVFEVSTDQALISEKNMCLDLASKIEYVAKSQYYETVDTLTMRYVKKDSESND